MTISKHDALLKRYANSPRSEASFWKGVVSKFGAAKPNWGLELNPVRALLSVDSFVYLVDTSNHWYASAAVAPEQLSQLFNEKGGGQGGASPEREEAARRIVAASAGTGQATIEALLNAFAAGLTAIARSPAYAAIRAPQGLLLGTHHWILLLYRLADGEVIAGLGHIDEPNPGMLDQGVLLDSVEALAQMDLGSERTLVNQAVRRAGGVILAPKLQHLIAA